ncbi:MAG: hypothetical protein Ct9H300mP19_17680 [Dehalococcoidia bacterium]|nr:MAG: hypothetical protein Ct9H300mP19_17680 [Dehalococcoidia bacterium]
MTVSWPSQKDLLAWVENDLNNWGRWGTDDQKGTLNHLSAEKNLGGVGTCFRRYNGKLCQAS